MLTAIEEHPIPKFVEHEGGLVSRTLAGDFFIGSLNMRFGYRVSYSLPRIHVMVHDKSYRTVDEAKVRCQELFVRAALSVMTRDFERCKQEYQRQKAMLNDYLCLTGLDDA